MNESQFSNTSQLFHNEYYLNTSFIDNLKHQSLKIQRLMDNMENIKAENKKKQAQIIKLKKNQSQLLRQLEAKDRQLMNEQANQLLIKQLKNEIKELSEEKEQLERKVEKLKQSGVGNQSKMLKVLLQRQRQSHERMMGQLQKQIRKIKEAYINCKEENSILRHELETEEKLGQSMKREMQKEKQKIGFSTGQWEKKLTKADQLMKKCEKQRQVLKQQKSRLQKQLKEQELYFKEQLFQSEDKIQAILFEFSNLQHKSTQWKNKYTELELLIHKIQTMRTQYRVKKGNFWNQAIKQDEYEETIIDSV